MLDYGINFFIGIIAFIFAVLAFRERWQRKRDYRVYSRRAEELADLHEQVRLAHLDLEQQHRELRLANIEIQTQNAQLQAVSEERLMILGMVSHDLKNPLTAIQGLAEAMTGAELSVEEYQEYAGVILDSSHRMNNLVRGFLDLSRLESGTVRLQAVPFNILAIVQSFVEQYSHIAAQKRITILLESDVEEDCMVCADESATQQVIENLLSNAVKYSPHSTTVRVRVFAEENLHAGAVLLKEDFERLDELAAESRHWFIRLEVIDEGPGLSTADKLKLFGKFARLSARPTGGEESTGLGLAIVKTLVESMQGRVWCESEVGKGATFIVELPAAATM